MHELEPAARMDQVGATALGDAELLSFLLAEGGSPSLRSLDLARAVLRSVGGASQLLEVTEGQLQVIAGVGMTDARRVVAAMCLAARASERPIPRGVRIFGAGCVYEMLRGRAQRSMREHLWVLALDGMSRRLSVEEVARGGMNRVYVEVSQVFRVPLLEGAASIVLIHNHPCGDPTPSLQDVALTERISAAGNLVGIDVLDHIVIGSDCFVSMGELGYVPLHPVGLWSRRTNTAVGEEGTF